MSQFESQFEEDLYHARRDTLDKIVALGQQAYPNSFAFTHTVPQLLPLGLHPDGSPKSAEALEAEHLTAAVAGRIVAIRLQGKAGFATLLQNGARLQIYVRKDDVGETAFDLYKLLDLGDHIGVRGTLMRTRTGELTLKAGPVTLPGDEVSLGTEAPAVRVAPVRAAPLTFLTKAMLPLPDKFSGLGDIELRYRRRYLDLFTDTGDFTESTVPADAVILSERSESKDLHHPGSQQAPSPLSATDAALKGTGFSPSISEAPAQGAGSLGLQPQVSSEVPTPTVPTQTRLPAREVFVKRAAILRAIRNFFDTRGYLEVETPMLHTVAGGAAARPFATHHNALDIPLSLRIAPELYLKRLVVGGFDRVYEINRNFRNEGVSTQHNPEFTMLEFYQAYANYHDLMDLTQELITTVAVEVNGSTATHFPIPKGSRAGEIIEIDLGNWRKLSMREAIIAFWPEEATPPNMAEFKDRFKLAARCTAANVAMEQYRASMGDTHDAVWIEDTKPSSLEGRQRRRKAEIEVYFLGLAHALETRDDPTQLGKIISEMFEALAEEHLIQPTIIYDFPLAVSPLSKVKPDEPDWVERFEFYIGGFEVGNAFSELNDPADQLARFEAQVADKDPESMAAVDEDYVRSLGYGLPPTAGEGIGIDRLTMILTGSRSIRDVILFPLMRPQRPTTDPQSDEPHGESAE